ncbi:hypothetical protein PS833_06177 [Pseudomonas fluorescens]|uniref:Pyosin/cloacin translocation domain-containing protein n=2 Tax=Pseudomonas fluorescens TaxID=294 RepID=A0A5E7FUV1_PSEFL|nr:hypothetical protein PS833_06177 [Pseudomonas fluorescens]
MNSAHLLIRNEQMSSLSVDAPHENKEVLKMELKATLKEYTASEFQALVNRIWAVDLPKQDHDRLINHFDRIVGHPQGADLLFYADDSFTRNSAYLVVDNVRNWHEQQGLAAFQDEAVSAPRPSLPASPLDRSLVEVQKIAADVAGSELAVETAFGIFERGIQHWRSHQSSALAIPEQEARIRTLELAQQETLIAVRKFEFHKMRIQFAKNSAQSDLKYAQSQQTQWQGIAHQINATHDRYLALLATIAQRHRAFHDQAEALLVQAQEQLIRSRTQAGVGAAQTAHLMPASMLVANKRPDILLDRAPSTLLFSQQVDLQKSIRSAVAEFTWRNTSGELSDENQCAGVLQFEFSSRADTKIFGLSVPLSELQPLEGQDWQALAADGGEVEVFFRMGTAVVPSKPGTMFKGLREIKVLEQVYITPSPRNTPSARVRVRVAQYVEQLNAYSFTADGTAPITVR